MVTKEDIREHLYKLGMCAVGFTHGEPFRRLRRVLKERQRNGYLSGFEKGTVDERCRPTLKRDWVRSIISVAYPYKLYSDTPGAGLNGVISSSAAGGDYHRLLRKKLEQTAGFLSKNMEGLRYEIMVDTGPLADREVACRAGLGWYGKNCSIIVPPAGSAVFLAEMLVNIYLRPDDVSVENDCDRCARCIDNCPTGALKAPYILDARMCISYLTQKRGIIPRHLRSKMGVSLYGCDKCLISCPYNEAAVHVDDGEISVDLNELINMEQRKFDEKYEHSAIGWRGLNVLKRNAVIALGNRKDPSGLNALKKAIEHGSPIIRGHAVWAVGRIGGHKARRILEKAVSSEKDEYVREEINAAINEQWIVIGG